MPSLWDSLTTYGIGDRSELAIDIDLSKKLCLYLRCGYRGTSVPASRTASVTSLIDWLIDCGFFSCDLYKYIGPIFTKLPINIKPKINVASTSVGKTQSGCLLSVTGYQYAYRYILLSDLKTKHYMPYLSCIVTHIFSVDYWRDIECA